MGLSLKSHLLNGRPQFYNYYILTLREALTRGLHDP